MSRSPSSPATAEAPASELATTRSTSSDADEPSEPSEGTQSFEQTYRLRDRYAAELFLALTRRRGLLPYRRARQHETTVCVRASLSEQEGLWSAFCELDRTLAQELSAATLGFIRTHVPASPPNQVAATPAPDTTQLGAPSEPAGDGSPLPAHKDWGEPDAQFDYREAKLGSMIRFAELFPQADSLVLHVDDESFFIDDDWCAQPSCDCKAGMLHLYRIADGETGETNYAGTMHFPPSIRDPLPRKLQAPAPALRDALTRSEVTAQLEQRRAALRSAAAAHMSAPQTPLQPTKYGRNAPCACGSGKKFKKCCMRAEGAP